MIITVLHKEHWNPKKTQALDKWFKEHIPTYYISIDKEFNGCESIKEWKSAADKADKERKN